MTERHAPTVLSAKEIVAAFRQQVLVGSVVCVVIPLLLLRALFQGSPVPAGVVLGIVANGCIVACLWAVWQPVTPFRIRGIVARSVRELDPQARKVLTWLRRPRARLLAISTAAVVSGVVAIAAIAIGITMQARGQLVRWVPPTDSLILSMMLAFGLLFAAFLGYLQLVVQLSDLQRRWNQIQDQEAPWPSDRPFWSSFQRL